MDDVQVRENLTVEALPIRIEDREVKQLRGKNIALVKMVWRGPARGKSDLGARESDEGVLSGFILYRFSRMNFFLSAREL